MNDLLIYASALMALIYYYNSLRNRHYLTRSAVGSPRESPWRTVYLKADENSFLDLTGFTRYAFNELLQVLFEEEQLELRIKRKRGRPSMILPADKLGLFLFYVGSRMQIKYLCLLFGLTPSTVSEIIRDMTQLVCEKLQSHEYSKFRLPKTREEMNNHAELIRQREPLVTNCIGFVDGLAIPIECSGDMEEQAKYYNGYQGTTTVNNVFAFSPTGKIMFAAINYVGSWHDSQVATHLIEWAKEHLDDYVLCVWIQASQEVVILMINLLAHCQKRQREHCHQCFVN